MIIEISSHGGFGGISATQPRRIDTETQAPALRAALCEAFGPEALSRLAASPCPSCSDRMRYAITVTLPGQDSHSVTLSEGQMSPDMLDLIDTL